jgi:hypothetical protein
MKERPIIFSTESVRAILAGRKTQTRRVLKPQPDFTLAEPQERICPFGKPGDRLWVKERFTHYQRGIDMATTVVVYSADYDEFNQPYHWKSPMFMPRKYSRITLEIVNVRCEQILDMPREDVFAEGYATECDFVNSWNALNAKRGYSWDSNPYVWVLEFKRVEGEQ